jgi:putative transposase
MAEACYTLEQIEKLVQQWRYDAYGPRPRRRIMSALLTREAPIDCWRRLAEEHVLPDPPGPDRIAEIFMVPSAARTVQHYGVEFNGIQYHGPTLRRILEDHGRRTRVEIRYDPTDIRMIMVRDPDTGVHVPVPAKEPDLPAIGFATLVALKAANPEWKSGDITARAIAVAIATGTYRSSTAPRSKMASRRHAEVGQREREEVARRSRTTPKIAATAAPDDQIALPAPMLGIPRPTRPTDISTK